MKKENIVSISIIVLCLLIAVLCFAFSGKKKDLKGNDGGVEENSIVGGWALNNDIQPLYIAEDVMNIFNKATESYTGMTLEPIVLLGSQVVAGKNYMFLCKGTTVTEEAKTSLQVVIVYNDLNGNASITSIKEFDYTKYVSKEIENNYQEVTGGWTTISSGVNGTLDEKTQTVFDNVTSTLTGFTYKPIALLGTQVVAGTNYAVLCYGSASYDNKPEYIYLITIYEDLNGNQEITSHAYVDISEYNK